ncbi:hypothetical protein K443DRAFT_431147, partial [Laccaria amethystina LaAM-08-1]
FQFEDRWADIPTGLLSYPSGNELWNQRVVLPIDIHLSRASRCAEQLIEIIRSYNPDTFPLMAHPEKFSFDERVTTSPWFSRPTWMSDSEGHEKRMKGVRKGIARYLLDNSQMYEQWLALKREEDRKIRSSLTYKLGTVPLLHVVCYLLILAVYFKFQWVFFSSSDPHSWQCSFSD